MKQFASAGFFIALALAGLATSVFAAGQAASDSPLAFVNADKNHDGSISRSEVPKELNDLRAHFDQYDENHDHRLSQQEYGGFLTAMVAGACQSNLQGAKNPNCQGTPGVLGGADRTVNTNSDRTSNRQ
ncbi:MAG: EF-hand domain-containing protein [Rhodanobacter sp.]